MHLLVCVCVWCVCVGQTKKKHELHLYESVLFNVWPNKKLQATGESFNNSIIGIQTRTNWHHCNAYKVQSGEGAVGGAGGVAWWNCLKHNKKPL